MGTSGSATSAWKTGRRNCIRGQTGPEISTTTARHAGPTNEGQTNALRLTDHELATYTQHGSLERMTLKANNKPATMLHSLGSLLNPCPCGCRAEGTESRQAPGQGSVHASHPPKWGATIPLSRRSGTPPRHTPANQTAPTPGTTALQAGPNTTRTLRVTTARGARSSAPARRAIQTPGAPPPARCDGRRSYPRLAGGH